jgi:hypothetical protein
MTVKSGERKARNGTHCYKHATRTQKTKQTHG